MIGRTLGNYRIVERIGLGGMATVYKGYDPDTDRYVAIKILPHQFADDPQFQQRFQREAKAIAKLEHIHILPIFAYGEEDGIAYMVMRYLPGGSLADRITEGPLPFSDVSRILEQLASALDYAHAHGILHRDMKPSNVLLDEAGNAYLMDFGIAKIMDASVDLTGDRLLGTPAYMSPEQCKGEPVGPASDIYSLGIILYEMVTGRRPFHAETPVAVIMQQLNDPLPPPRNVRPDLPEKAENVIFKALAKKPESRYKTASDLAVAFAGAISEAKTAVNVPRPVPATELIIAPEPVAETAVPAEKRRVPVWVWGVVAFAAVAGLILLGMALANYGRGERETAVIDSPDSLCPPDQTLLVFDEFEDGNLDGWEFSDVNGHPSPAGWEIVQDEDGNHMLAGIGHSWAHAHDTFGANYSVSLRVRRLPDSPEGGFHINVRMGENGRYFISDNHIEREPGSIPLANWDPWRDDLWHDIRIIAIGNHIEIFRDNEPVAVLEDPEPVVAGNFALENVSGTILYDDVVVCAFE